MTNFNSGVWLLRAACAVCRPVAWFESYQTRYIYIYIWLSLYIHKASKYIYFLNLLWLLHCRLWQNWVQCMHYSASIALAWDWRGQCDLVRCLLNCWYALVYIQACRPDRIRASSDGIGRPGLDWRVVKTLTTRSGGEEKPLPVLTGVVGLPTRRPDPSPISSASCWAQEIPSRPHSTRRRRSTRLSKVSLPLPPPRVPWAGVGCLARPAVSIASFARVG